MISDAQFTAWLARDDVRRTVLAELDFAYESGGAPAIGSVYLSDGLYSTESWESPASIGYIDAIIGVPKFSRQIDQRTLGGAASLSFGSLELNNADGRLDFLLDLVMDGHEARFYVGDAKWERSDFRRMFVGLTDTLAADADSVTVRVRDPVVLLDRQVMGDEIGGAGPNADRRKPLVFGSAKQVEALLGTTADLVYWAGSSDANGNISDIRDSGLSIFASTHQIAGTSATVTWDAGADTVTYTAHGFVDEDIVTIESTNTVPTTTPQIVEGVSYWVRDRTADTFKLAVTRGGAAINVTNATYSGTMTIRRYAWMDNQDGSLTLAHSPAGRVTMDWSTTFDAVNHYHGETLNTLVLTHADLPPSRWYGRHPSAPALEGSDDVPIGIAITEPTNVIGIIDEMMTTIAGFWSFRRDGTFQYGRILNAESATHTLGDDDIIGGLSVERIAPKYSTWAFVTKRNWTRMTDGFAAAMPAEDIARLSQDGIVVRSAAGSGTTYAGNPALYHKSLADGPEILTVGDSVQSSQVTQWAPHVEIIRLSTRLSAYTMELGDCVTLTSTLLGFDAGVKVQVIGIDIDLTDARIDLTFYRRRTPDTTTAAHYG